jgi:hypothetical protein
MGSSFAGMRRGGLRSTWRSCRSYCGGSSAKPASPPRALLAKHPPPMLLAHFVGDACSREPLIRTGLIEALDY